MRLFLILFLASPALGSPWLDGPTVSGRRGNVEETSSHRPCDSQAATTKPTPKASKEDGCLTCGNLCCCRDCKCTAATWDVACCAMPQEERIAYIRKLQKQLSARSVPTTARPFTQSQPVYSSTPTIGAMPVDARYLRSTGSMQTGSIGIGAYAGTSGSTSGGG
jgi:hypothetical protein